MNKLCRVVQLYYIIEDLLTEEEIEEGVVPGFYEALGTIDLFEVQVSYYTMYNEEYSNCTEVEMINGSVYLLNIDSKEFAKLHTQAKNMKDLLNIN